MTDKVKIFIPKFKKWQGRANLPADAMLISKNVLQDEKIGQLIDKKQCWSVCLYFHLLSIADNNGQIALPEDALISSLCAAMRVTRQGFNYSDRLKKLEQVKLIEVTYPADKRPEMVMKVKRVRETKPEPRYSAEAKSLAFRFIKMVKEKNNIIISPGAKTFAQFSLSQNLIQKYGKETVIKAMDWAFTLPELRARITSMVQIGWAVDRYLAFVSTQKEAKAADRVILKDSEGKYTRSLTFDPSIDESIPFEQLDFECMQLRLMAKGRLNRINAMPIIKHINDIDLQFYINHCVQLDPIHNTLFKDAIEAMERLNG